MGVLQHGAAALIGETAREKALLRKVLPQSHILSTPLTSGEPVATLALALRTAGDVSATPLLRDGAAQQLLRELRNCTPGLIAKHYRGRLHGLASDEVEALAADAIQHALLAALKNSQFRGDSDESARAWLRAVLSNFVADDLRRRKRTRSRLVVPGLSLAERSSATLPDSEGESGNVPARDLEHALRFLSALRSFVVTNHRSQDAETLLRAAWVQLSYAAGASTEEQVRLWMPEGLLDTQPSPAEQKRLQDRIYQMRHRGREIILRACTSDALVVKHAAVWDSKACRQSRRQK